jgi:hypothetical protein
MAVPKTAVNEDHFAETRENKIGYARKIFAVQPVSIAEAINQFPNNQFRLCVLGFNSPHSAGADF